MPEPAATRRVRSGRAGPSGVGVWEVRSFPTIDSTNRYLLDQARAGAPAGVVAVADHQSAGRGRLGRRWEAAPGSALLASVLLRPAVPPDGLARVGLAAALALADALDAVAGIDARVKWPNDLVVDDRKIAGLLAEAVVEGGRVRAVVVGAGCNLTAAAIPVDLADAATACELVADRPVERDQLLDAMLACLGPRLAEPDVAALRARSATLGRRVRVHLAPGDVLEGEATAITDAGALVVRADDGTAHHVTAGDVVHLRLARSRDGTVVDEQTAAPG